MENAVDLYSSKMYMDDVRMISQMDLPWGKLKHKTVFMSGVTGLIGSFLVDVLMLKNEESSLDCKVIGICRDSMRAKERFSKYANDPMLELHLCDIRETITDLEDLSPKYVLHLASNTHPLQYSSDPIGTITTNIIGLNNMLSYAVTHNAVRFVFASSNEVYGENRGDTELFSEDYLGYLDSNTLRAGYPESKRCGEALCQAYRKQKGLDIVIPRLTRTYGPTMLMTDSKALSQFIRRGIAGEDIILKSSGAQFYSYQYVADSVSGILRVMLSGDNGEAYNIADESGDITLRDLADVIAEICSCSVIRDVPAEEEAAGYSTATKARLDGSKLQTLGWNPIYDIRTGVARTIAILSQSDSQGHRSG